MPEDSLDDPVEVLRQLPDEPALARAGHADDGHDPRPSLATRCMEQVLEQAELAVTAEERRLELVAPSAAAAFGDDADRAECRNRRLLALEDLVPGRFECDRLVGGTLGGLADQDGSGLRDRLQPRRGVDQVARDHALVRRPDRDCRFAGQDPGAGADAGAERLDRGDDVEGRADCPFGVVLSGDRGAPYGHDRVADELLDRAAVATDHLAGEIEVARQELAGLLRVPALRKRCEAHQVSEQDRDKATFRDRGVRAAGFCGGGGRRAFGFADACGRAALGAELGTGEKRRATLPAARLQGVAALGAEAGVGRCGRAATGTRHLAVPLDDPRETVSVTAGIDRREVAGRSPALARHRNCVGASRARRPDCSP